MPTSRVYRLTTVAMLAATAMVAAACDDSTGSRTPAERADAIRTVVELFTTGPGRILRAGSTVRVSALVTDEFDQALPGVPLIWTASGGSVAADSGHTGSNGILSGTWTTGTHSGLQDVVATVDGGTGILDRSTLFVYPDTVVGALDVAADADSAFVGTSVFVRVVSASDRYGNPYVLAGTQPEGPPAIEFTSLDPAVAVLTATTARNATVRALSEGTARVVARSDGKADTVAIRMVPIRVPTPH